MKDKILKQKILFVESQYLAALETLNEAVIEPPTNQFIKDATIQRFEYTYELAWKLAKHVLSARGLYLMHPKEVLRECFKMGWIQSVDIWEDIIDDRNLTSHTYKSRTAEQVYRSICDRYFNEFKHLSTQLTGVINNEIRPS